MKILYTPLLLIGLFVCASLSAQETTPLTVKEQLVELNEFWKTKDFNDLILNERYSLKGDVALIQMHLSLVEQKLREKNTDHLTTEQKENRNQCLAILNDYWNKGVFPTNLYHKERTPYFIDHTNVACAVGQLIIATGHEDVAHKIAKENNNGYIKELNQQYPEISTWADHYGFEMDELAWIQPCYCGTPTGPAQITHVSCFEGADGSFYPDFSDINGPAPYLIDGYYGWFDNEWHVLWCGPCDLPAGDYKCEIFDAVGTKHDYLVTINQPDSFYINIVTTDDNGNCNGTATAETMGGGPIINYTWQPGGETTQSISGLCAGTYTVHVLDAFECFTNETVEVMISSDVEELEKTSYVLSPNPTTDRLTIQLNRSPSKEMTVRIFNTVGEMVWIQKIMEARMDINLASLNDGLYFLSLDDGKTSTVQKIIKKN